MRMIRAMAGAALAVVLVACGPGGTGGQQTSDAEKVATVRSVEVMPESIEVRITAVGTVEPERRVVVSSQQEGSVTGLFAREGDRVDAGDLLIQLDDRELQAQLAEAEARLRESEAQWQRASSLAGEGLISPAEADSARATFQVNRARVDALHTRLSFTRVTAPVAGVVTVRHIELGDVLGARSAAFELASGKLVLRVPVSELEVVKLHVNDEAAVHVDALPGQTIPATINRIFPAADQISRQVTVELVLQDAPDGLRPGFLARAELLVDRLPDALMVPEPAVMHGTEIGDFVYVVKDGTASVRPVQVGLRQDGRARVVSGLAAGDRVVVEGGTLLRDGSRVMERGA